MNQIRFKARLVAPYFKEIPPEIEKNWAKKSKQDSENKDKQGGESDIKTPEEFDEEIGKKAKKGIASFIDPKFVSRSGRNYNEIMNKTDKSLERARKEYPQKVKDGRQKWQDEDRVQLWRNEYARKWCKYIGPLKGYKKDGIKGLVALGVMTICGDPELKNFLKKGIDKIGGRTCWAVIKKPGLKRLLDNRIAHWCSEIIGLGYEEQDITRANEDLNKLVNEYRRPEIAPFSPTGISHIDFIVTEIPDPDRPGMRMKWLGLDVQVSRKE